MSWTYCLKSLKMILDIISKLQFKRYRFLHLVYTIGDWPQLKLGLWIGMSSSLNHFA